MTRKHSTKQNPSFLITFSCLFFALTLLLTSCETTTSSDQQTERPAPAGSSGIDVSFVQGVPPDRIYVEQGDNTNSEFEVVVNLQNSGSFPRDDLGSLNGKLYLTGFDPSMIRNGRWDGGNQFNRIQGVSSSFPEGGFEQKSFVADSVRYPFDSKEYPLSLMLSACFYYETYATAVVCVDPNPASQSQDKVCHPGNVRLDPQNAPVKVTSIQQSATSRELIFTIEFSNVGGGKVLKEFQQANSGVVTEDRCTELEYDDTDRVGIDVVVTGLPEGTCSPLGGPQDPIRMYDGKGTVTCKFPMPQDISSEYTTQMSITLKYGYLTTAKKDITLVNTGAN